MLNKRERLGIIAGIVLFIAAGLLLTRVGTPQYPPYVSLSPTPDGTKGLYLLMKESGMNVDRWELAWRYLPNDSRNALVVIEPGFVPRQEREQLLAWIARGNDVIWFEGDPRAWDESLSAPPDHAPSEELNSDEMDVNGESDSNESGDEADIDSEAMENNDEDDIVDIRPPSPITDVSRGTPRQLEAVVLSPYRIDNYHDFEPILRDEHGTVAARGAIGDGSLTLFVVPEWTNNGTVLQHDHFELVWPHLKQAWTAVWFDEYHHGYQQSAGLAAVYPDWLLAVAGQLLLALLLWLLIGAVRFGPAYTPREWTVRRGDETMLAAASWYERRKLTREALELQQQFVRELIRERWGVSANASDQQLIAAARANTDGATAAQLARLLQRWERVSQLDTYPVKSFVEDSRLADEIIQKLMRK